ncbi:MAG: SDR family oxidoreductase [bacterium]|nr:SDR family oxidoreductase [bacterium]
MMGKVAVVTGGTRGIGRAISLALAGEGMSVLAPYARNRRAADELEEEARAGGLDIVGLRGDLSREAAFRRTVDTIRERAETVDVLVHAAATGVHRPIEELTPKHLRFTFETNVFAIHALLRELLPRMPAGGRVVGLTSSGATRAFPAYAAVGGSKGALDALFRHYAVELAPRGIAVNLVCPGAVRTGALDAMPDTEERIAVAEDGTPTGRLTTCEEVARVVLFLCGDDASQIIGQTIVIDGGRAVTA